VSADTLYQEVEKRLGEILLKQDSAARQIQILHKMLETKDTKDNEPDLLTFHDEDGEPVQTIYQVKQFKTKEDKPVIAFDESVLVTILKELITNHVNEPFDPSVINNIFMNLRGAFDEDAILKALYKARNDFVHGKPSDKTVIEYLDKLTDEMKNSLFTIIPLRLVEEPLTPQTLALVFTALTELTTKLLLIAKHRFADLIEYTQTHDVRFANEAGSTIAYVTYNSPFNFGLQVDKLVPGVADAVMTIVDGLSQRKAKREKVEIDNLASAQRIKEAAEALKQQQRYSKLEREKMELGLERMILENEKERQALVEQRLESRIKQVEYALELAGKAVDTVYPNADTEMRPILIQTLVNNILQIDSVEGLQLKLALPEHSNVKPPTKKDTEQ
jgi:hypothetical protein